MKLFHPDPAASITVDGVTYDVGDDAPDSVLSEGAAHGFLAASDAYVAPAPSDDVTADGQPVADPFDALNRNGLFAWLRDHDVSIKPPVTNEELKAACRAKAAELAS